MEITLYSLAQRYVGQVLERPGPQDNHPLILWWLSLCQLSLNLTDEIPWCGAFMNGMAWELRAPRSKSAAARSWLLVGIPTALADAKVGWDVVILNRGGSPDPAVIAAPGHVGLFAGLEGDHVLLLGGNQGNGVSIARFPVAAILGIRRLV